MTIRPPKRYMIKDPLTGRVPLEKCRYCPRLTRWRFWNAYLWVHRCWDCALERRGERFRGKTAKRKEVTANGNYTDDPDSD